MINRLMTLLAAELHAEGIPDPLTGSFTLAAIWDDLCRLSDEIPPKAVWQFCEGDRSLWKAAALPGSHTTVAEPQPRSW